MSLTRFALLQVLLASFSTALAQGIHVDTNFGVQGSVVVQGDGAARLGTAPGDVVRTVGQEARCADGRRPFELPNCPADTWSWGFVLSEISDSGNARIVTSKTFGARVPRGRDSANEDTVYSAADTDGALYAAIGTAAWFENPPTYRNNIIIARFRSDGNTDPAFGSNGLIEIAEETLGAVGSPGSNDLNLLDLEVANGRCYLLVQVYNTTSAARTRTVVVRLTTDGRLDSAFGTGGIAVVADFQTLGLVAARAMGIGADGRVVIAGMSQKDGPNGNNWFALWRLHADGSIDSAFGAGGRALAAEPSGLNEIQPSTMALQDLLLLPDGRLVVAGGDSFGGRRWIAVRRFLSDGSVDTTFGAGGTLRVYGVTSGFPKIGKVVYQPDGKLLLFGATNFGLTMIWRIDAGGNLLPDLMSPGFGTSRLWVGTDLRTDAIGRLIGISDGAVFALRLPAVPSRNRAVRF